MGWEGSANEVARLFGSIADQGFTEHSEFARAIDEFVRLDEAVWARQMRDGMGISFPVEEEH
jgi:hypothetical protein